MTSKSKIIYYSQWTLTVFVVLIGIYFRIKGLGKWPFALDEYYIIKSVHLILEKGIPEFDAGGFYNRGILFQYLVAVLISTGLNAEFATRIIPVLLNIAAMPALFIITKKITNKTNSLLVIILFVFSLWEIELARFGRMYTFFQTTFIWYLLFLYQYLFESDRNSLKLLIGLSFISIFVYEGSIFLVLLNMLTVFWNVNKKNIEFNLILVKQKLTFFVLAILIFALFYLLFDFRTLYLENTLPKELSIYFKNSIKESTFRKPFVLLFTSASPLWGFIFKSLLCVPTTFVLLKIFKSGNINYYSKFAFISLILLGLFNLYSLLFLSLIIFLLLDWLSFNAQQKNKILMVSYIIILNFVLQNVYSILDHNWHNFISYRLEIGLINNLKILWKEFLNYPNFYELFSLFRDTYKIQTYLSMFFIAIGTILIIIENPMVSRSKRIIFTLFFLLIFEVTFINTKYFETRYFFFLYPMLIICFVISLNQITNLLLKSDKIRDYLILFFIIIFILSSEDYNINHLINIDNPQINFRIEMTKQLRDHFYPRWDSKTAALIINKEKENGDLIISDEQISEYYLDRLDYLYRNYTSNDFPIESVNFGTNERWTNAKLLYTYDMLKNILLSEFNNKWLIINKTYGIKELEKIGFFDSIKEFIYFNSIDRTTVVYKIPKGKISLPLGFTSSNY